MCDWRSTPPRGFRYRAEILPAITEHLTPRHNAVDNFNPVGREAEIQWKVSMGAGRATRVGEHVVEKNYSASREAETAGVGVGGSREEAGRPRRGGRRTHMFLSYQNENLIRVGVEGKEWWSFLDRFPYIAVLRAPPTRVPACRVFVRYNTVHTLTRGTRYTR